MNEDLLPINPEEESKRITSFLKQTFAEQKITNAVIGLSGGIDSATSFALLRKALQPENIFIMHLYYETPLTADIEGILREAEIPESNIRIVSIRESVDTIAGSLHLQENDENKLRKGNIAARVRMIMLFDYAKEKNALVCGTENKSENLLGYFTRFGDQASDIEPLEHLYKTHIYQLANYLKIPEAIIKQHPSAGLWQRQTDEGQFGFTYEEADQVLYLSEEKQLSKNEILEKGFSNTEKILAWRQKNLFKHNTPYTVPLQ